MIEKLRICKVRNVKTPVRAHDTDAGIDFFIPEDLTQKEFLEKCEVINSHPQCSVNGNVVTMIMIQPGQSVLIPSGIKVDVPPGYMLQFTNKSGVASKKHLIVGANVVDTAYQGECHINLHNVGTTDSIIRAGDKIVQGILIPISSAEVEVMRDEEELYNGNVTSRGTGGFGSSGTK